MSRNLILAILGAVAILLVAAIGAELLPARSRDATAARTQPSAATTATAKAPAKEKTAVKTKPADADASTDEDASADADEAEDDKEEKADADDKTEDAEDRADPQDSASAESLTSDILARPLFAPTRRPPSVPAAAADSRDSTLPRLTGIVVLTGLRLAIFQGTDKPLVVREGGRVAGRKVQTIGPLEVVLQGPQGEEKLRTMPDSTLVHEQRLPPGQAGARPGQPVRPGNAPRQTDRRGPSRNGAAAARAQMENGAPGRPGQPGRVFFPPGPNRNRP